jgi:hypothetical protein
LSKPFGTVDPSLLLAGYTRAGSLEANISGSTSVSPYGEHLAELYHNSNVSAAPEILLLDVPAAAWLADVAAFVLAEECVEFSQYPHIFVKPRDKHTQNAITGSFGLLQAQTP